MALALWVALAGALGVLARYGVSTAAGDGDAGLWAIAAINVLGSFALGAAMLLWAVRGLRSAEAAG